MTPSPRSRSLEPAFAPQYAQQHGCVWFDLPSLAEGSKNVREPGKASGWAAVGGEPAFSFASWRDLPTEVVWWTNLSRPEAWTLGRWSYFKDSGVLGANWLALMNEWGQGTEAKEAPDGVRRGSEIMARLGHWLSAWASGHDPDRPWIWGQGSLPDALSQRWGWSGTEESGPQPVLQSAFAASVLEEVPSVLWNGRRRVTLSLPRLAHVRSLWETRYPIGPWAVVGENDWPVTPGGRAEWAARQSVPLLIRVDAIEWRSGSEELGWLWLGLRGRAFPGAERDPVWLTGEEVRRIQDWADVFIGAGYRASGWTREPLPAGWSLGEEDPLAIHAPMPGLLGWAAFQAAASPTRDPQRRLKQQVTARAVWWRAAERQRCFEIAVRLHRQGWSIAEYGNGQVVVVIDPHVDAAAMASAVRDAGLIVPPLLARSLGRDPRDDLSDPLAVALWIRSRGDPELLCDLDRLVAPWPGPLEQVQTVLKDAAQRLLSLTAEEPDTSWKTGWKELLKQQARISVDRVKRLARRSE